MWQNPYLYLYSAGSFSNGLFISLRGPLIPELARRVRVDSPALGTFLGLGGISGGACALPVGLLLDRAGVCPHHVLVAGVVLRAVSVGALPLCQHLWHVNALAVVQGATLPLIGVSIRTCLVRVFGKEEFGAALNFTMGSFGVASILAPLAYSGLSSAFPRTGFDLTLGAACAMYLLLAAVIPCFPSPPPENTGGDGDGDATAAAGAGAGADDDDGLSPRTSVRRRLQLDDIEPVIVSPPGSGGRAGGGGAAARGSPSLSTRRGGEGDGSDDDGGGGGDLEAGEVSTPPPSHPRPSSVTAATATTATTAAAAAATTATTTAGTSTAAAMTCPAPPLVLALPPPTAWVLVPMVLYMALSVSVEVTYGRGLGWAGLGPSHLTPHTSRPPLSQLNWQPPLRIPVTTLKSLPSITLQGAAHFHSSDALPTHSKVLFQSS